MSRTLHDLLQKMIGELPGCLHTSVIDEQTGLALAAVSDTDELDAAGADAFHNDLYRMTRSALEALPVEKEPQEIVLRGKQATFVSKPIGATGYIWLVVTEKETTVGFVQAMMRKHVDAAEDSLAALV